MSNVLNNEKKQEVLALGRLGWSVRRIEQATGVRRETASAYLKSAGIAVRLPGGGLAKPATKVATDPDSAQPNRPELLTDWPEPCPSRIPVEEQDPPLSFAVRTIIGGGHEDCVLQAGAFDKSSMH